jgi:type VI secretion system protein ImpL
MAMFNNYWVYILAAVLLLALLLAVLLYVVLRGARKRAALRDAAAAPAPLAVVPAEGGDEPAGFIQFSSATRLGMKASFARALKLLKTHVTSSDYRYRLPWFLMVGEAQSGKTTALANADLNLPLGRPAEVVHGVKQGVNWFFYDKGVVIDVAGDFVLRGDGDSSNDRGWNTISRLLQQHRPERPIDGIVLTIPADDLVAGGNLRPEQRSKIERKAAALYRKLWQAQKVLGMSFPVYVLVTKCDQVAGFKSLCREIPAHLRQQMFGWSSPYTLETSFKPEWVDEAFHNIYRQLFQIQVEVFAERSEVQERDSLFLLPTEMQALRAPLRVYLEQIFKQSSFHESFFFRGLYFCGDGGGYDEASAALLPPVSELSVGPLADGQDPFEPPPPAPEHTAPKRPVFLRHLFEWKVFPEDMLARPVVKTTLSRNRTVLAAQILSLAIPAVGALGIATTYAGLERRRDELQEVLAREDRDLREVNAYRLQTGTPMRVASFNATPATPDRPAVYLQAGYERPGYATADFEAAGREGLPAAGGAGLNGIRDNGRNLLEAMSKAEARKLGSPFIPSSWFSAVNERVEKSLVNGFEYIVLEGLRLELDERTETFLLASTIADYSNDSYSEGGGGQEGFRTTPPVYDQPLSANPDTSLNGFIESFAALRANRARYEDLVADDSGTLEELGALGEYLGHERLPEGFDINNDLYREALKKTTGRPLALRSSEVQKAVAERVAEMVEVLYERSFEVRPGVGRTVRYDYLNDIARTEAMLARPEYTWLATYVFDARSSFHDMTLSSGLHELRKALEGLSREGFMAGDPRNAGARPVFQRRQLVWDLEVLRQAVALYQEYEKFGGGKSAYSRNLNESVRQAALSQFKANLAGLLARAQRFSPTQRVAGESAMTTGLVSEIQSFTAAQGLLGQLLEICERTGVDVGLRGAVASQASHLLGEVGRKFKSERFYATAQPDFSWWRGTKPVSSAAFGMNGPDELAAFLAAQRKGIAYLGRELAAPVSAFAAAHNLPVQPPRLGSRVDWDEILGALERYDNKQPGNTVALLENFIRFEMDRVDVDDCAELMRASSRAQLDFFTETRNVLRWQLNWQCKALALEKSERDQHWAEEDRRGTLEHYRVIEAEFNRRLAGRFPFHDAHTGPGLAEADPDSIIAFFKKFEEKEALAEAAVRNNQEPGQEREQALAFLERMRKVRDFFDPFLKKQQGPSFDFNFQFRVNQEMEVGGNQIIDWSLDVGRKKYNYHDGELTGRWAIGEPVRLTLRWANNSPSVPAQDDTREAPMRVRDRVVTFDYANRWSLLSLMLRQSAVGADFREGVDVDVYTLKFRVPTRPHGEGPQNQPPQLRRDAAEVFMRMSLVAPGTKEPLHLPAFPARAPKI